MLARILRIAVEGTALLLGALIALVLLASTLLILYTTTDDFRTRLLARLEPELDSRMAGDLSIGGLEGSPLTALRFQDATLSWHGEEIARVASVAVALDWNALLTGRLRVARVGLEEPQILFREHARLGWDWRDALAPLIPGPDDPRPPRPDPLPVVIETLAISNGRLRIAALDRPVILLESIDLRGRVDFGERYFRLEQATLATGDSKLSATGEVPFEGRFAFEIEVESLHSRDLARIDPAFADALGFLPATNASLVVSGEPDVLDISGQLRWPETKLRFDLRVDQAEPTLERSILARSTLKAHLESRDLARFVPRFEVAGALDLALEVDRGEGTFGAGLHQANGGELRADGSLSWNGTAQTRLRFAAKSFDLARAWTAHPEWAGSLTGSGTLDAAGRDRDSLAGSISLGLEASKIGALTLQRGRLRAKLDGESIELAELALESPVGRAALHGRLSTTPGGPVALEGRIDVDDLQPLLALARRQGAGRLHGDLDVEGQLTRARVALDVTVSDLQLDDFRAERLRLILQARGGRKGERVEGVVDTAVFETALGIWQLEKAVRLRASENEIELDSARFASGEASILLGGRLARSGRQDFRLEAHALPIAEWARAFPERLAPEILTAGVLDFDLAVGGTAAAPTVDAHFLPDRLVLGENPIESADATIGFAARRAFATLSATSSPSLRLDARAEIPFELAWQSDFVARAHGNLDASAVCEASDLAILEPFAEGRVEKLGGRGKCQIELAGPLDALRPSGTVQLHELTGSPRRTGVTVVDGELEVELAADRFFVRQASATVLGHEKTARFRAEGEGPLPVFLTRLVAKTPGSASNPASTSNGDYITRIELDRWPLIETTRDRLIATGFLSARGTFEAPRVEGRISIDEGKLRPNLTFLSSGPPPRDPTIEFEVDPPETSDEAEAQNAVGPASQGPNLLSTFEALELEVDIDLGKNLLIQHEKAEALLSGTLAARKRRDERVSLAGRIEAQRGFADLQNRRFRLIDGSLEFIGSTKIDPLLDILARHRAPAHTIDARLTGTASKPVLTLSSDPTLSQEDILAVLLFGRPASELSEAQQTSLGQRASEMASSLGITVVGRTVASAIGLDALGLQIEEISSSRARVGAYVGRNIFVALGQEFSGERGQELSIEYEFFPGWSVVGSTTSQGTNSADLVWKLRY